MWTPRPGTFHYGRTEKDYTNLLKLHEKYKLKKPPLQELKEACLADGYSQEKVLSLKYKDLTNIDVNQILGRTKRNVAKDINSLIVRTKNISINKENSYDEKSKEAYEEPEKDEAYEESEKEETYEELEDPYLTDDESDF